MIAFNDLQNMKRLKTNKLSLFQRIQTQYIYIYIYIFQNTTLNTLEIKNDYIKFIGNMILIIIIIIFLRLLEMESDHLRLPNKIPKIKIK